MAERPILFTHSDLDGAGCALVMRRHFGKPTEVRFCNAREAQTDIQRRLEEMVAGPKKVRPIWIADLGLNPELAAILDSFSQRGGEVRLFDHHATSTHLRRYPWAIVDEGRCAAYLLWQALGAAPELAALIEMIDDRDRWVKAIPGSDDLAALQGLAGMTRFLARFTQNPSPELTADERLLLELQQERRIAFCRERQAATMVRDVGQFKVGIVLADAYISELGHYLIDELGLDVACLIDLADSRIFLRSRDEVDISGLARQLGGGGHRNAGGAQFGVISDLIAAGRGEAQLRVAAVIERALESSAPSL